MHSCAHFGAYCKIQSSFRCLSQREWSRKLKNQYFLSVLRTPKIKAGGRAYILTSTRWDCSLLCPCSVSELTGLGVVQGETSLSRHCIYLTCSYVLQFYLPTGESPSAHTAGLPCQPNSSHLGYI